VNLKNSGWPGEGGKSPGGGQTVKGRHKKEKVLGGGLTFRGWGGGERRMAKVTGFKPDRDLAAKAKGGPGWCQGDT